LFEANYATTLTHISGYQSGDKTDLYSGGTQFESEARNQLTSLRFLGASAKLRKVTINFVISVRPSAWDNSAPS